MSGTSSPARRWRMSGSGTGRGTSRSDGEDLHAAVARECLAARHSLGIMDASTLGKIDARGPDVVEFLERIYTHNVGKMKVGRCAYGIMLGEDGMVMDDGVMARIGEQRFYLTTTTGGAANVLGWLESWLQTEWPELEVYLTSLTDQFSTIAVVGPEQPQGAAKRSAAASISARTASRSCRVNDAELAGVPVQLFRVSFSGELAFEINVDSSFALDMWQSVMEAGEAFGITPVRHRNDARAARRERLHHRRPGHRRLGDAGRPRHELAAVRETRTTWAGARLPDPTRARRIASNWSVCCPRTALPCSRRAHQLVDDRQAQPSPCRCAAT